MSNAARLARALQVNASRTSAAQRLLALAFPAQLRFILDKSRFKSALCPRRAGKSVGSAIHLLLTALQAPGVICLYVALTRPSAKAIMWRELKRVNRLAKLGLRAEHFNETELILKLPNGSEIKLYGVDADSKQADKLLGIPYALVIIDEAASFRFDVRALIYDVLRPATMDTGGTIAMVGTPGEFKNFFYEVTAGGETTWARHRWSTFDNPHMAAQLKVELAEIDRDRPLYRETPEFRCMYLGEWAFAHTNRVYQYSELINLADEIPACPSAVIGIDLGWNDASSFSVATWQPNDPCLYFAESTKKSKMLLSAVAEQVEMLRKRYPSARLIVDGASKQAVMELRSRYHLPLIAANKVGKADFIRQFNTDLLMARIKLARGQCDALIEEWANLLWDRQATVPREIDGLPNDCADSALYAWRYARNYLTVPRAVDAHPLSDEDAVERFWEREHRALEEAEEELEH